MELNPVILHRQLVLALEKSVAWRGYIYHPETKNAYRSAYFCYQVGCLLDQTICNLYAPTPIKKRQICFNEHDEKIPGEWLLDIVWTENYTPNDAFKCTIPKKVWCAVECESNTSINHFFMDFAKLVNVISPIKIFLAGLNQTTVEGAKAYRQIRLDQAAQYISASKPVSDHSDWYISFWPSPKSTEGMSLWDSFNKHPHLKQIHLYRYVDSKFEEVEIT